jgi:hypothetical protein
LHLICAIIFLLFDLDFGFVSKARSWFPLDLSLRWHHFLVDFFVRVLGPVCR